MPAPQWKGYLKLSLVSVPVKAHPATSASGGSIQLNQLHADCKSRIRYKKTCPIHGEVQNDDIVSGYEYARGQYAVVQPAEVDKLRTEDEKAIRIDAFVRPDAIDPVYLSGKNYFLLPEGKIGSDAYQVIYQGMVEANRHAIAQAVMHGTDHLLLIRPHGGLLMMSVLIFASRVASPSAFADEVPKASVTSQELELVKALIKASGTDKLVLGRYKDVYTEKLTTLIETKVAGQELVSPPPLEPARVINLMDALRQSVQQLTEAPPAQVAEGAASKPLRKMAGSKKPAEAKKKRSS
jgi:DNA end-binding protein Ku